jgi:3D-(3,5/4)-trihydroxycyclohexane-1,2-dione acylhydrolase (decyclizing)
MNDTVHPERLAGMQTASRLASQPASQPASQTSSQTSSQPPSQTVELTAAQALVRYLAALRVAGEDGKTLEPLFGGVFAIFGHGNVAALSEALHHHRAALPTMRAHNEQAMAHAAVAYAKAHFRRRMMAVTTSIGPGATNLVTAAALAHVNRLPVLLLPGDIFVSRAPDPVLQQVEDMQDGGISANDCLRPVSRYFDRIVHPAQLLSALPRAIAVLTDPAQCGPVTLALPQDVQAAAYAYPASFFEPRVVEFRAPPPDAGELRAAVEAIRQARRPLIVAGGGVLYGRATTALADFAGRHGIPVAETQAGKGSLRWDDPLNVGAIGVTGSPAANELAREADLVIAVGTRLSDFTTGSNSLFRQARVLGINTHPLDALKHRGLPLCADARCALDALGVALGGAQGGASESTPAGAPISASDEASRRARSGAPGGWLPAEDWSRRARAGAQAWRNTVEALTAGATDRLPYEADVIGAIQRSIPASPERDIVVCAAGTLPAELHKLWRAGVPGAYHVEYGFSCMGYEIAGALGVKLARPDREVIVTLGDGSYLMMNSEIASSVALGAKLIIVVLDNRGYGCINRLQQACGTPPFNNLLDDAAPRVDFAAHARALGAQAEHVDDLAGLAAALGRARAASRTYVISIDTDPARTTGEGGWWWEVAVPEVSASEAVRSARVQYEQGKLQQQEPR